MKIVKTSSYQRIKSETGKSMLLCLLFVAACIKSNQVTAQEVDRGYFKSISIGANVGTTGVGFDVATPIGNYLALRAGVSIMPNFKFTVSDVEVDIPYRENEYTSSLDIKGTLKRTSGEVLLNIYLSKTGSFFLCGGFSFGGDRLVGIDTHTDNAEILELVRKGENVGIEIGDFSIPFNKNGDISGGLKAASFRPYIGIGTGRAVPKGRLGFMVEGGVQLHKKPKVYTDYGTLGHLEEEADNGFNTVMDILSVYPVIRFRLCGRIF